MIFQELMMVLLFVYLIGCQVMWMLMFYIDLCKNVLMDCVVELMDLVGLLDLCGMLEKFLYQFLGGMCQWVMIVMVLLCNLLLLLVDELIIVFDVMIEVQIFDLICELQEQFNMGVLFIIYNFGVVVELVDCVMVMFCGDVVEEVGVDQIFYELKVDYI